MDPHPFFPLRRGLLIVCALAGVSGRAEDNSDIRWLVHWDGKSVPGAPAWSAEGSPETKVVDNGAVLVDSSKDQFGFFRAGWKPEPDTEVVVEATLQGVKTTGAVSNKPTSQSVWPWRDGAPVGVLVSDGEHQEGLVFYADRVSTWTDRFALTDVAGEFHTYRAVIRGTEMSVAVDGVVKIRGQNAFWKPAAGREAFIQFGSNSKRAQGEAVWQTLRLGLRKISAPAIQPAIKVVVSEPWSITRSDLKTKPTRPYVYHISNGRLLMSVAEGPDALFEPYGVMLSIDEGKTWTPVKDHDFTEYAPLPIVRLKEGGVLGMSRWTWPLAGGGKSGRVVHWEPDLSKFTSFESRLQLPPEFHTETVPFTCERDAFEQPDGSVLMAGYSKTGPSTPEGIRAGRRFSHLMRSTDGGKTWNHYATIGAGGEPAVAKTGEHTMTAVLRTGPFKPFAQVFSEDDGKTWSPPVLMEEGSVCPDLVPMSNGLLACSYGRPASCLMFSADGGRTWSSHHVISDKTGFNYSGIVEVTPGRLLYLHDGGGLQGLYVDVTVDPAKTGGATSAPPAKKPVTDYALRTAKELKPTRTVVYKKLPDRELELPLFEPKGLQPGDRRPCFLAIHGGGWTAGTPDVVYCVASHFAERGWVGVSLRYRIQRAERKTTVFDCVRDGRSAMRYLRAHAAELGIDVDRIVAGGRSAGGHVAAGTALFDEVDEAGEDTKISCVPNALVLYSAVLDTSEQGYGKETIGERWEELSPLRHVRAGLPPTLVLHGIRDTTTPVAGAQAFADEMVKAGNRCELILNQRGNHSYMMRTQPLFAEAMEQTHAFLAKAGFTDPVPPANR